MRALARIVFAAVLLMIAASALAVDYPCADNETNCGGEVSDTEVGGDGTGSNYKPPTVDTCSARASMNQGCRACVAQIADDGQWTGYSVCGYVTWRASCNCKISGTECTPVGSCTYYAGS